MNGNLVLCRTRLEEAERHLREFVAAESGEVRSQAAEALALVWKALELLRTEESADS